MSEFPDIRTLPPPAPTAAPTATLPADDSRVYLLQELTRQYRACLGWQTTFACGMIILSVPLLSMLFFVPVVSFFLVVGGVISLIVTQGRKPAIRQKVAELGINTEEWARPMESSFRRSVAWTAGVSVALFLGLLVVGSIANDRFRREVPTETQYREP